MMAVPRKLPTNGAELTRNNPSEDFVHNRNKWPDLNGHRAPVLADQAAE